MRKEPASATRPASDNRAPRVRSAVTNGRRLHVVPPEDTRGASELSEAQRELARRAATIALECEKLQAKAVAGEAIDVDVYGQRTDRLGRAFGRLGIKRVARDVTPSLAEYITATYGERDEETTADRSPEAGEESDPERAKRAPVTGTLPSDCRRPRRGGPAKGRDPMRTALSDPSLLGRALSDTSLNASPLKTALEPVLKAETASLACLG